MLIILIELPSKQYWIWFFNVERFSYFCYSSSDFSRVYIYIFEVISARLFWSYFVWSSIR